MSAEVKPGYKMTEAGVIPEDWSAQPLAQLVSAVEYGSSAKSASSGDIPVLRMGNLQDGRIDWSDLVFTSDTQEIERYTLKTGDVLFNRTNTIDLVGKTAIYEGNTPAIFAGYLIRIKEKKDLLDSRYLNYILNSEPSRKYGSKVVSIAVGQANINGQKLKTYPIPLPSSLDEQKRIADAITEMEEFIAGVDQLIAKKRDIKQATMQQLLTGQRRLPGFSGEWRKLTFGEIARPRGSRVDPRSQGAQEFCIELEHLESGTGRLLGSTVANENASLKTAFLVGDVLFGKLRAYLRKFWLADRPGVCSTEIWALESVATLVTPGYLEQIVMGDLFIEAASNAHGTHMPRSDWHVVKNLEILLPTIDEQTAIATILSDMDTELAALEARRDKARQLKQGMMQELLTGRIRLLDQHPAHSGLPAPELQA